MADLNIYKALSAENISRSGLGELQLNTIKKNWQGSDFRFKFSVIYDNNNDSTVNITENNPPSSVPYEADLPIRIIPSNNPNFIVDSFNAGNFNNIFVTFSNFIVQYPSGDSATLALDFTTPLKIPLSDVSNPTKNLIELKGYSDGSNTSDINIYADVLITHEPQVGPTLNIDNRTSVPLIKIVDL